MGRGRRVDMVVVDSGGVWGDGGKEENWSRAMETRCRDGSGAGGAHVCIVHGCVLDCASVCFLLVSRQNVA